MKNDSIMDGIEINFQRAKYYLLKSRMEILELAYIRI